MGLSAPFEARQWALPAAAVQQWLATYQQAAALCLLYDLAKWDMLMMLCHRCSPSRPGPRCSRLSRRASQTADQHTTWLNTQSWTTLTRLFMEDGRCVDSSLVRLWAHSAACEAAYNMPLHACHAVWCCMRCIFVRAADKCPGSCSLHLCSHTWTPLPAANAAWAYVKHRARLGTVAGMHG